MITIYDGNDNSDNDDDVEDAKDGDDNTFHDTEGGGGFSHKDYDHNDIIIVY